MKSRIKSPAAPAPLTRTDAEKLLADITRATIERQRITAELDATIAAARAYHEPTLTALGQAIDAKSKLLQAWAEDNEAEFGNRKSINMQFGTIGFRTGTPKTKTRSGWTWPRVLEKLLALPWGPTFVRVKQEVDKDGLIAAAADGTITAPELADIGVKIVQEESFFVDPDVTALENRIVKEAA